MKLLRMKGFGDVQVIGFVVTLALLGGGAFFAHKWWEEHKVALRAEGANVERLKWEARERTQLADNARELAKLRAARDAETARLQADLEAAQTLYEKKRKEASDEKKRADAFAADLRDGRVVLNDPGARGTAPDSSGSRGGAAGPAAPAGGDGVAQGQRGLSPQLANFLWGEAGRADTLVEDLENQLELAQNAVRAYYRIAVDCHAQNPRQ